MGYDVFISYRRSEGGFYMARLVRNYLESAGVTAFMDLTDMHTGRFDEQIEDAIRTSRYVIVILPPGALDRCATDKEDWLKQEILLATENKNLLVPVWLDKFQWPEGLEEKLPPKERDAFENLRKQDAVHDSRNYFDAMMALIINRLSELRFKLRRYPVEQADSPMMNTERYFRENMIDLEAVQSVDFAFHAGSEWLFTAEKRTLLNKLIKNNVPLRILVNTCKAAESTARHMRQEDMNYIPFSETAKAWRELAKKHPEQVTLRFCDIPMMRRYLSFHMRDEKLSTVNVKHYTFGNGMVNENYQSIFNSDARYFRLYRDEFEFLWNASEKPTEKQKQPNKK